MTGYQVAAQLTEILSREEPWQQRSELVSCLEQLEQFCNRESWFSISYLLHEFRKVLQRAIAGHEAKNNRELWRALAYIAGFLEKGMHLLSDGCEDKAVYFAPLFNELRALQAKPFFSENTLFFPKLEDQVLIGNLSLPTSQLFSQGVTAILKNENKRRGLAALEQAICETKSHLGGAQAEFWRVLQCYVELVQQGKMQLTYASRRILADLRGLFEKASDGEIDLDQSIAARQQLHRMLYYISLYPATTPEQKWCYKQYCLDHALYRLEMSDDVAEQDQVRDSLVTRCRAEITHHCSELARMTTEKVNSAVSLLFWQGLYDALLSLGHFRLAKRVQQQLTPNSEACNLFTIGELLQEINQQVGDVVGKTPSCAPTPASHVVERKQTASEPVRQIDSKSQEFLDDVFALLSSILQELEAWEEDQSVVRLTTLRNAFTDLARDARAIGEGSLAALADGLHASIHFILDHPELDVSSLVALIDKSCNVIPDLAECFSHGTSSSVAVADLVDELQQQQQWLLHPPVSPDSNLTGDAKASPFLIYASRVAFAGEDYAIPTRAILGMVAKDACTQAGNDHMLYQKKPYRVMGLPQLLGYEDKHQDEISRANQFVLYSADGLDLAIPVTQFLGNEEIVVKALSKQLEAIPGVLGAATFVDGGLSLVIDLPVLANSVTEVS